MTTPRAGPSRATEGKFYFQGSKSMTRTGIGSGSTFTNGMTGAGMSATLHFA